MINENARESVGILGMSCGPFPTFSVSVFVPKDMCISTYVCIYSSGNIIQCGPVVVAWQVSILAKGNGKRSQ